ncbi:hypothetical protein C8D87_102516 [Lentzea atacamensis]|uniref:Uncharacterized protein n=1 Tax=Lentzea atacamensis TaxID=531938 RepID=A0ABX9EFN4_9PSEU|nr:hypothetical protein C8D87_102516 [Lentzea atacamensis]
MINGNTCIRNMGASKVVSHRFHKLAPLHANRQGSFVTLFNMPLKA